tara:strand:- start:124 stop:765 length:642 start_codon:yes stop_codon:yes gene_type:complete
MPDEREKFSLKEMFEAFDMSRISLGGPVFDIEKLSWLNGVWIREEFSDEQLANRLFKWAFNQEKLLEFLPHARDRIEILSDLAPLGSYLISGMLQIDRSDLMTSNLDEEQIIQVLQYSIWRLEGLKDWNREEILSACNFVSIMMDLKLKIFLGPVFMALSGSVVSISVMDSMCLLGREMSLARLRHALELMGGVGKKKQKKLEKTFNDAISSA